LYEKKDITTDEIEYIKNTVNFLSAKEKAVKYLSLKLHCEKEVRKKLKDDGYENSVIQSVIAELVSMGYINDKIYARKYAYDRSKLKPISRKLLRRELQAKGINKEIIDEVLADWEVDDAAIAESLVKRRFSKYDLSDEKIIKRIYSFLSYRGFSLEIIENIINKYKNNTQNNLIGYQKK